MVSAENPKTKWDLTSIVSADINCDGKLDFALIGIEKNMVKLALILGSVQESSKTTTLKFGLNNRISQDSLCGEKPTLKMESQNVDLRDSLGENPEGFKRSSICKGLNLSDGECDSFHFFWNHQTNLLDWWRL